jgi:predicted alpha/beta-hydrolase family hydrolase
MVRGEHEVYAAATLAITGYRDEPVPHTFLRQDEHARHVAILLPGIGYTCDMPLLYYPARLLLARGADVLRVEYTYQRREDFKTATADEQGRRVVADVTAACHAVLAQRDYEQITLVAKSLGTLALGPVLAADPRLARAHAVWLTPLLRIDHVRAGIARWGGHSLFVIGTADPYYDAAYLAEVQNATRGETVVLDGADHSLEIDGDVLRSLEALMQVMRALQHFLP